MSLKRVLLWTVGGIAAGHVMGRLMGNTEEEKQRLARNGRLIGGGLGFGYSATTEAIDTVNYTKYHKGKRVYDGVTTVERMDIRPMEHRRNGMKFDKVVFSAPKTRSEALDLERYRIKRFKGEYNIHHNC